MATNDNDYQLKKKSYVNISKSNLHFATKVTLYNERFFIRKFIANLKCPSVLKNEICSHIQSTNQSQTSFSGATSNFPSYWLLAL
jgi:hypothetical protein